MNYIRKICVFFLFSFLILINFPFVSAITITNHDSCSSGETCKAYSASTSKKKDTNGNYYYCSEFYKSEPPSGTICEEDSTWDKTSIEARAIGQLLNENHGYIQKELILNYILATKGYTYYCYQDYCVGSGNKNVTRRGYNDDGSWENTSYYLSIKDSNHDIKKNGDRLLKNNETNNLSSHSISITSINNFIRDGIKYKSTVNLSGLSSTDYTITFNNPNLLCTASNKKKSSFDVECTYTGSNIVTTEKFDVTVKSNAASSYLTSIRYDCTKYYQKLFSASSETISVSSTANKTKQIGINPCISNFKNDKASREQLYRNLKSLTPSVNFEKLLDFNVNDFNDACKSTTISNYTQSCLNINYEDSTFNNNNWSKYTDIVDIDGLIGYCKVELSNFDSKVNIINPVKSGQLFFNLSDGIILSGKFKKICYFVSNPNKNQDYYNDIKPDVLDYIKKLELKNNEDKIEMTITLENETDNVFNITDNSLTYTTDVNIKIPKVYVNYVSGKKKSRGRFLGYGILSKLDSSIVEYNFITKIDLGSRIGEEEKESVCIFNSIPEIIKNGKLNLEFEIINTKEGILDKNGNSRTVGKNWCTELGDCSAGNKTIIDYIINSNDSYNKTGAGSKYTIILDSKKINNIRKYNKQIPYDDVNLICEENKCISKYLTDIKSYFTTFESSARP